MMPHSPAQRTDFTSVDTAWPQACAERYGSLRAQTLNRTQGLSAEDCQVQSMPEASPLKWHLAHTTWFFETFVLEGFEPAWQPVDPAYRVLFNSYYNAVGDKHPRPHRGLITRPSLAEVLRYRNRVDEGILNLLHSASRRLGAEQCRALQALVELGLHHEQQHQELMLTDFKHLLWQNPLLPACRAPVDVAFADADADAVEGVDGVKSSAKLSVDEPLRAVAFDGGLVDIGHAGDGFCFDNEGPRHRQWLAPYALSERLVSQGEWQTFIDSGGYQDPRWWLSAGWDWVQRQAAEAPLYWMRGKRAGQAQSDWQVFTLQGLLALQSDAAVLHINLYEADAYCRWRSEHDATWAGARLPTEAEWEAAASAKPAGLQSLYGPAWQWTSSAYAAYPGYQPWAGAVGEYNGKFMVNQYVLRGASCATPAGHSRLSYRNFFPAEARWQFTGLRLARSLP